MNTKERRIFEKAIGVNPYDLEPKPTGGEMNHAIKKSKKRPKDIEEIQQSVPQFSCRVDRYGDGVCTTIFNNVNRTCTILEGDQSRNFEELALSTPQRDWDINIENDDCI